MTQRYWTVAQTVSRMEHLVRRDIERTNHGAFLPTCARRQLIDNKLHVKERPIFTGYVFFMTTSDDWAGIPDIHGVYRVPFNANGTAQRVLDGEMKRISVAHAAGEFDEMMPPRFTRFYGPPIERPKHKRRRTRPRKSRQFRETPDRYHPDAQLGRV